MSKRQFRLINSISHRYLTIDDHILRTVDQKQALIVSEAVGRQLLKKVNRIAEALAQANGTAFNEYRLEEAPLATIRLGSEDLDALIETVQLLGCSYEEAGTRIKHQKIRQDDQKGMHQYYGLSIPHKIR